MTKLVRNSMELDLMRKSGRINALALKKVLSLIKPGVFLDYLDSIAEKEIVKLGGKPAFKTVPGYYWATCLSVNDEVVHGIPRKVALKVGDIIKVDIGTVYQGWYTDAAWTVIAGEDLLSPKERDEKRRLLKVGQDALWKAIDQARDGNKVGDISNAIQQTIEGGNFNVVKSLSGHGVGRSYHEEPEVPEFGKPGTGPKLISGMTIAIEPIYAMGNGKVYEKTDHWTIATSDHTLSAMFEMTVIIDKKAEVITDWRN